ncbi:VOC family protein [Sutcliffiella horikoshii]|uniref:SMU1112c/YaeR family gloxylase I-like metalloprotein n=1 Tax=Sutcliffiella horikoshii TaxID=79883 RepID=UPI00203F4437|nr:VOC family protein [Sutcliffiella horikoshii]MCM3620183.1 VOC family protein [Sutcliffiella horikoshii]
MNLTGIHHIAIICSNYEKSKHFYTNMLWFPVIREVYREERDSYKLDLQLPDGTQLELFSFPEAPARPSYPEAQGLRHLAFSTTDILSVKKELEGKGVMVEKVRIDEHTNRRFTFFSDPDGLPIELYEE